MDVSNPDPSPEAPQIPAATLTPGRKLARRKLLLSSTLLLGGLIAGAYYWPLRWRYIVIHHSAGNFGDIDFLQRVHRNRQAKDPIDAIPYHYVIGNGNGLAVGEVASDWRQAYHLWGAHVSMRNRQRNFCGIGICLVGNLEEHPPLAQQYAALVALTRSLMTQYNIPLANVSGHGYTLGERTKCPGQFFPMAQFLKDIQTEV